MSKFFTEEVPAALDKLTEDTVPEWGKMSPQHMIEHVVGSWRISNGRAQVKQMTSEEDLPRYRDFMFSDKPYKKNTMNSIFIMGLPPLRKANLEEAKNQLRDEMKTFFEFHESNPGATFDHPVFGSLDMEGWLVFQRKHMGHHFTQFGLLEKA
jgi:hypothetical protein